MHIAKRKPQEISDRTIAATIKSEFTHSPYVFDILQ